MTLVRENRNKLILANLIKGPNRVPVCIMWDKNDQRFFIVQTSFLSTGANKQEMEKPKKQDETPMLANPDIKFNEEWRGAEINTFFCTSETGIKRQDSYRVEQDFEGLFGKKKNTIHLNLKKIYFKVSLHQRSTIFTEARRTTPPKTSRFQMIFKYFT